MAYSKDPTMPELQDSRMQQEDLYQASSTS